MTTYADPAVAQQVLVSLLSQGVQHALAGELSIRVAVGRADATLDIGYAADAHCRELPSALVRGLAAKMGWSIAHTAGEGSARLLLHLQVHYTTILVIDDNQGLARLIELYLAGHGLRVVACTQSREALAAVRDCRPDAIVLDVMMPEMDGWEVLQRLQTSPESASIPVLVCSVFNDPELAFSLGAAGFMSKPLRRERLLAELGRVHVL